MCVRALLQLFVVLCSLVVTLGGRMDGKLSTEMVKVQYVESTFFTLNSLELRDDGPRVSCSRGFRRTVPHICVNPD